MIVCMKCMHTFCWNCLGALKGHTHISGKCDPELAKKENMEKYAKVQLNNIEYFQTAYFEHLDQIDVVQMRLEEAWVERTAIENRLI